MKWPIRLKFMVTMSGLLAICLGSYLLMAVTVFKSDKTQLVYDLNRSQVSNLASEVETALNGASEKLKLFAQLPANLQTRMAADLFSEDSDVVAVSIFKLNAKEPLRSFTQAGFLETYGLSNESFSSLLNKTPIPFKEIVNEGEELWNNSAEGAPPLIGYGRLVIMQNEQGVPVDQWAVIGYIKLDRFLKSVSVVRLSEVVIANRHGEVLVHRDARDLFNKPQIAGSSLFKQALESKTRLSVSNVDNGGEKYLAATAKAFKGHLIVIAQAPENEVFRVVKDLGIRTMLFGTIVLTLVILAAFGLARSITQNLDHLTERMEAASEGDLTTAIVLKGRDETVRLAMTFNQMISDLRDSRDELEKMNRELDLKVRERTEQLEIQNLKVKEAQEALLRTTRLASVGEIAGRTAHEVLNPLTSLLTRAGLMQKRVGGEYKSQLSLLNGIREAWRDDFKSGGFNQLVKNWQEPSQIDPSKSMFQEDLENLQAIAQELLQQSESIEGDTEFIKVEGNRISKIIHSMRRLGHVKSEARSHSLHSILSDCCHIMADLFDQKHFKIEKHFSAEHDEVLTDRDEMIQSVTNLMRNSLQALEAVGGKNGAMILRTRNESGSIIAEIEDTGAGVAAENQGHLFEASFTTKPPDQGTGLGLGISRRFVRSYGGDIEFVSSIPNKKTVFRIRMPLKRDAAKRGAVA